MPATAVREPVFVSGNMIIDVVPPSLLRSIYDERESHKEIVAGSHFECLRVRNPDDTIWILITNSEHGATLPIDRDTVIDQRKELNALLFDGWGSLAPWLPRDFHVSRFMLLLDVVTRANMLKLNTSSPGDVIQAYVDNTRAAYSRFVSAFLDRFPPLTSISSTIESQDYSLLRHFSLLYTIEINELLELHKHRPNGYLTVVDEATCSGFFITTCASVLPQQVLARTRFLGTDLKMTDMVYGMEAARQYLIDVTWQLTDINDPDHPTKLRSFNNGCPIDLLVLNHILEHLDCYTPDEYVLQWLMATQTLIISVPFESNYQTSISSHVRQFDEISLLALGACVVETSGQQIVCDTRFVSCGLLIFRHVSEEHENRIEVKSHAC
jgi:hypothetical protein